MKWQTWSYPAEALSNRLRQSCIPWLAIRATYFIFQLLLDESTYYMTGQLCIRPHLWYLIYLEQYLASNHQLQDVQVEGRYIYYEVDLTMHLKQNNYLYILHIHINHLRQFVTQHMFYLFLAKEKKYIWIAHIHARKESIKIQIHNQTYQIGRKFRTSNVPFFVFI